MSYRTELRSENSGQVMSKVLQACARPALTRWILRPTPRATTLLPNVEVSVGPHSRRAAHIPFGHAVHLIGISQTMPTGVGSGPCQFAPECASGKLPDRLPGLTGLTSASRAEVDLNRARTCLSDVANALIWDTARIPALDVIEDRLAAFKTTADATPTDDVEGLIGGFRKAVLDSHVGLLTPIFAPGCWPPFASRGSNGGSSIPLYAWRLVTRRWVPLPGQRAKYADLSLEVPFLL
jgi:hypothetical protein